MLNKRRLHRMQFITARESFDRNDLIAFVHQRESETGVDSPAVDQHGARAALAMIAAFFRTGQLQSFPQCVEQRHPRIDIELVAFAVDLEIHLN